MNPIQRVKYTISKMLQQAYPLATINVFIQDGQFSPSICNILQHKQPIQGGTTDKQDKQDLVAEFINDLKNTKDDDLCNLLCQKYKFKHSQLANIAPFIQLFNKDNVTEEKHKLLRNTLLYIQMDHEEPHQFNQNCGPICRNWCLIIKDFLLKHIQ